MKPLPEAAVEFIEEFSLSAEADGFPRIAGRIVGLLIMRQEPVPFEEIAEQLQVSRGSVSTSTRLLESRGALHRICRLGERKDLFEVGPDFLERMYEQRLQRYRAAHHLASKARAELPASYARTKDALKRMEDLSTQILDATEKVLLNWKKRR